MDSLKNILSVALYVFLSVVLLYAIFCGVRNIWMAWKTRNWKNIAFTIAVFIAAIAFFVWAGFFGILDDTCHFFSHLFGQLT